MHGDSLVFNIQEKISNLTTEISKHQFVFKNMTNLFAGIHLIDKANEFLPLNVNFEKNIFFLKETIANKIDFDAQSIEVVYNGVVLNDNTLLSIISPYSVVHIFKKTQKHEPYKRNVTNNHFKAQSLFAMISHLQITVNSRVNILQKILAEYPEFRRNLGAQALIRDSVLFNTLQLPEVIKNVAEKYPIICEAAPFIVATIKKELTKDASALLTSELATDSTNSSEEEGSTTNQSEQARIRRITRNQLATALHQAGTSSVNSLSNISQRNSDSNTNSNLPSNSAVSNGRITSSLFSNALARALSASNTAPIVNDAVQWMDTSDAGDMNQSSIETSEEGEIPSRYREHQYAEQLRIMAQMGFTNYRENLTFLNITAGNIENAINLIMGTHDAL